MGKGHERLRDSLRYRDFRLLMAAVTTQCLGSWAYHVGLIAWVFERTGSAAWVSAVAIARFTPAMLLSAYGGVVAERFERVHLMVVVDLLAMVGMILLAIEVTTEAPVALAVATAAIVTGLFTAFEPAAAALTPQLVGERDLTSANALRNIVDSTCVVVGPAVGAALLAVVPPQVSILANSACFAGAALMISRTRRRSLPTDVTEGGRVGALRQMLVGVRGIAASPSARVLVGFSVVANGVFGIDTVLFVVLSRDVFGTGAEGYGYLLTGIGAGAVIAAPMVTRAERLPRLSLVILTGMAAYCVPTLVLLLTTSPAIGFAAQMVRGAGAMFIDVLAVTALQRTLAPHMIARVFGAFDALALAAAVAGSVLTPLLLRFAGLDVALWVAGAVIPLACVLWWPALRRVDAEANARRKHLQERIELLLRCDLFAAVATGGVDQLAGTATELDVQPGHHVVVEGDPSDAFYVVRRGRLGVTSRGDGWPGTTARSLCDVTEGDYFGEIGLMGRMPRTATVTAVEPSSLLRIDGDAFVETLAESRPSAALMDGASARLRRTHPLRHADLHAQKWLTRDGR